MSKYQPLQEYLSRRTDNEVSMAFYDVEEILRFSLPPAARRHRAWWSNNPSNSVMTNAWLGAGYRSGQVDMANETLKFVRAADSPRVGTPKQARAGGPPVVALLRRALAGTVRFIDGDEGEA